MILPTLVDACVCTSQSLIITGWQRTRYAFSFWPFGGPDTGETPQPVPIITSKHASGIVTITNTIFHYSRFVSTHHISWSLLLNSGTIHFYFLSGSMCPLEVVVRTVAQVVGGLAVFKYVQLLWTMEFAETHVGRSHRYAFCQLFCLSFRIAIIVMEINCSVLMSWQHFIQMRMAYLLLKIFYLIIKWSSKHT